MVKPRIVAVALVTSEELQSLGKSFKRAWPVDQTPCYSGLLQAIDEADKDLRQEAKRTLEQEQWGITTGQYAATAFKLQSSLPIVGVGVTVAAMLAWLGWQATRPDVPPSHRGARGSS